MNRPRLRSVAFGAIAVALAAAFVRLGVWQIDRHLERRAANEWHAARLAAPPVEPGDATGSAAEPLLWRRVRVTGILDYRREIVLRGRSWQGAPGVYVLTPLRRSNGPAVLVLRGWLPAADGVSAELHRGRPAATLPAAPEDGAIAGAAPGGAPPHGEAVPPDGEAVVEGIALPGERRRAAPPPITLRVAGEAHAVLAVPDLDDARRVLPYPIADVYVIASGAEGDLPRPVPAPALDAGPHLAYAIQWFAFAAIALAGTAAWLRRGA